VVSDALLRQRWYREHLTESLAEYEAQPSPLPFVGSFKFGDDPNAIATDMAHHLEISEDLRKQCSSWQEFYTS
jgi:hypothetical protein